MDAAECFRVDTDIGVDEDDQAAFGKSGAAVARGRGSHAPGRADDGSAGLARDGRGVVGRAVIDDDALPRLEQGVFQSLETAGERQCIIENRDDDTNLQIASLRWPTGFDNERRVLAVLDRFKSGPRVARAFKT